MAASSPPRSTRGVQAHQEVRSHANLRDLRSHSEKFRHFVEKGDGVVLLTLLALAGMWAWPQAMEYQFVGIMVFLFWASRQGFVLPFRMPATSGRFDPNDPQAGSNSPGPAQGIAFLGNEMFTNKELWLKKDDMCTHFMVFGSTGAGKALKDDTGVLTPEGFRPISALVEGDDVIGPDGRPTPVVGVFPQGDLVLWALDFEDGRRIEISGDHLWSVAFAAKDNPWVSVPSLAWETLSTEDLHSRWLHQNEPAWIPVCQFDSGVQSHDKARLDAWARAVAASWQEGGPWPNLDQDDVLHAPFLLRQLRQRLTCQPQGRLWRWPAPHPSQARALQELVWAAGGKIEPHDDEATHWDIWETTQGLRITGIEQLSRRASCRCIKVGREDGLFVIEDFLVTHNTETLISMAYNALLHGSGFIYVDGKGDNGLWAKVYSLVRSVGRDDDLLVINYMTGGQDIIGAQSTKRSNTLNPFISGSASGLTELLVSLMDEAGGDNAMWKGRAVSLISGIMFALVFQRDNEGLLLDVEVIRDHLTLEKIQHLTKTRRDLPAQVLQPLIAYLRSLPGYQENAPKQSETVLDQHGYLQMQFTRILGSLSDTYGFIFKTNLGEVDFHDVVVNRRILLVLLPALEKSPDELGNLGKIIVASLRQMMATGLGDILEGDYADVIDAKPTASDTPFMCILDEYGYYVVKGASVMFAQARSLNFSMVVAGQDYPAFQKNNNKEEAVSTIGNCNIKMFMKVEDPTETFDLFKQSVGQAEVSKTSGFKYQGGVVGSYQDDMGAQIERRDRGDWLDLKDQREGEAHIIFKSTLVRARMFYANPAKAKKLRLNHFLRVEPPTPKDIQELLKSRDDLAKRLVSPDILLQCQERAGTPVRLQAAAQLLRHQRANGVSVIDAGISGIVGLHRLNQAKADQFGQMGEKLRDDLRQERPRINAFKEPPDMSMIHNLPDDDDGSLSEQPPEIDDDELMLHQEETLRRLAELEQVGGMSPAMSMDHAEYNTQEIEVISTYPQITPEPIDPDDFLTLLEGLQDDIQDRETGDDDMVDEDRQ